MVTIYRYPQTKTSKNSHVLTSAGAVWTSTAPVVAPAVQTVYSQAGPVLLGPVTTLATLQPLGSPTSSQHRVQTIATPTKASPTKAERKTRRQSAPAPPATATAEGRGTVKMGGRTFERLRELGRGSFGVVWEARETSTSSTQVDESKDPVVALKCSKPTSKQMLEACLLEAEVLRRLAAALPKEVARANRVPKYILHCVVGDLTILPGSPTGLAGTPTSRQPRSQVLVAMSKLEGRPLDQWLYGVDENRLKTVAVSQVLNGPFPGSAFGTRDLASACGVVVALLSQMAPVFVPLDGIAYHRDISAHNFLIREEAGEAQFALLDFGLAVRASSWQQEFQTRNISGDPRYFTPAAWMLMVYGHKYVEAHPDASFLEQYKSRLDHYSFGLLCLEVFFGLWRGPEAEAAAPAAPGEVPEAAAAEAQALGKVRKAWHGVWGDAMGFFQTFHGKGFAATRDTLARSQAVSKYADKLRTLCTELRSAAESSTGSGSSALVAAVLAIVAGLIDPRASLAWRDLTRLLELAAKVGTEEPAVDAAGSKGEGAAGAAADVDTEPTDSEAAAAPSLACASEASAGEAAAGEAAADAAAGASRGPQAAGAAAAAGAVASDGGPERSRAGTGTAAEPGVAGKPAVDGEAAGKRAGAPPPRPTRMFSHRRNWTVDEAVSLTRGVTEVAVGWAGAPEEPAAASTASTN